MAQTTLGQLNVMVARLSIKCQMHFTNVFFNPHYKMQLSKMALKSVPANHLNRDVGAKKYSGQRFELCVFTEIPYTFEFIVENSYEKKDIIG